MKYQFIILSLLSLTLAQATITKSEDTVKALDAESKTESKTESKAESKTEAKDSPQSASGDSKEATSTPATSTDNEKKAGPHNPMICIPIDVDIKNPYWAVKLLPADVQEKVKALVAEKSNDNESKEGEAKSNEGEANKKEGETKPNEDEANKKEGETKSNEGEDKRDNANPTPTTKEGDGKKESKEPNKPPTTTPTPIADPTKTENKSGPKADTKTKDSKE